jgi:hypothetical protein
MPSTERRAEADVQEDPSQISKPESTDRLGWGEGPIRVKGLLSSDDGDL